MTHEASEARVESVRQAHWQAAYSGKSERAVSWYQDEPQPSLDLVIQFAADPTAPIIDVGGGASTLVDFLLARGFQNVTVLDLSEAALAKTRARLANCEDFTMWSMSSSSRRALCVMLAPAGVRRTPPLERSNKETLSCSSSCRMRRLRADCLMFSAAAACRKLPISAAAITLRSELKSGIMARPGVGFRAKLLRDHVSIAAESSHGGFCYYTLLQP